MRTKKPMPDLTKGNLRDLLRAAKNPIEGVTYGPEFDLWGASSTAVVHHPSYSKLFNLKLIEPTKGCSTQWTVSRRGLNVLKAAGLGFTKPVKGRASRTRKTTKRSSKR